MKVRSSLSWSISIMSNVSYPGKIIEQLRHRHVALIVALSKFEKYDKDYGDEGLLIITPDGYVGHIRRCYVEIA